MHKNKIEQLFQTAHEKLLKVARNYYLLNILQTSLKYLSYAFGLLLLYVVLEVVFNLSVPVRISFWVLYGLLTVFYLLRTVLPELRRAFWPQESDLYEISRKIGKNDPEVQDSLINFLQIYREQGITLHPAFKNISLKQLYENFKSTNFSNIISFSILKTPANRLLIVLGAMLVLLFIFPATIGQAVLKVVYPTRSFDTPLPVTLVNESGDLTILKNDPVMLEGTYDGVKPHKLWLMIESPAATGDSTTIERLDISVNTGRTFAYEINHVKNNFSYWFEARVEMNTFRDRPALSERAEVSVKERPFIRELQAKLTYPRYTRLPEAFLPANNGEITAIKGTEVDLDIEANKKLAKAWIQFQDTTLIPLRITENRARGSFTISADNQYQVMILDSDEISNYQPVKYSVFALSDELPFVEIAEPGQDLDLGDALDVPLFINLRDDFGFSGLRLKGRHVHAGSNGDTTDFDVRLPYQSLDQNRAISEYRWDVRPFYLIPNDYVEYYAEVKDNDIITGPKSARSKVYILRLPSMIEILENAEKNLAEQLEETEDLVQETKELKEKLEEINREMRKEDELSWERKKQVQEQLEKQKKSMEKMQEIQKELESMAENLDSQNMLSPETLQKYMELQQMMQDLASPELMEAMRELQEAMESADMDELKDAMEKFKMTMDDFEQKIERTFELFKRVQLEQKMDELTKMAEKLVEEQEKINEQIAEKTPDAPEEETPEGAESEENPPEQEENDASEENGEQQSEQNSEDQSQENQSSENQSDQNQSDQNQSEQNQSDQNQMSESEREQLAYQEQNLQKNTEFFEEKLQEAMKNFEEMMAEIAQQLQEAQEFMSEQQTTQQMQQMQQQIQQGQMKQSQMSGEELKKQLEMMLSMMQQAQQNMTQMQKKELMQAMQKVQQDMLRSSFQQEQLLEKSAKADVASNQITDVARQQSQLRENANHIVEQLVDISKKSFFISPEMSEVLSSLMEDMENGLSALENRNPRSAARSQQSAMSNFNKAIMSMQNSMNNLAQSSSGSGFEQFMQQLQQMAGQQGQLNQQTMSLFQQQGPNGQPSPEAMARMAAQQQMIQQSLDNLNNQSGNGNRNDVMGRLGELGEEMEKVIADLQKQNLDPKVIERQQRILSRLLDAQKSVREREYSKKRQAEREQNSLAKSPPELKQEMIERENQLRKELLESLKEGYSSEYKEFIKSYYEILSRDSQTTSEKE